MLLCFWVFSIKGRIQHGNGSTQKAPQQEAGAQVKVAYKHHSLMMAVCWFRWFMLLLLVKERKVLRLLQNLGPCLGVEAMLERQWPQRHWQS